MILVIDNYDSFTYNIVQAIQTLGEEVTVYRNDAVSLEEIDELCPAGIVISPGPGTPDRAGISVEAIRKFEDRVPILGVCLGHQCIGAAYGAEIIGAKMIMHGKLSPVHHNGLGLFSAIENPFNATRYHSLAISRDTIPGTFEVSAWTEDGQVMGIHHKKKPLFGLQFHPESITTEYGMRIIENFLSVIKGGQSLKRCFVTLKEPLDLLVSGKSLKWGEMADAMNMIMTGECSGPQISAFLTALSIKGETPEEIASAVTIMRERAIPINTVRKDILDTCGTGGDKSGSFNVSTTVAFVASGAGACVAKHGNRSVTSSSGSADVLEELGANLDTDPSIVESCLNEVGITFMFAPKFHLAMKYAIGPRREIGIKTIFNILGPLSSPANANHQVVGVYSKDLGETYGKVMCELGIKRGIVVHGEDGLDEVSLAAPTSVWDISEGSMKTYTFDPHSLGFEYCSNDAIKGGDARHNAAILNAVISGNEGAPLDMVLLNSAFAIYCSGIASDLDEGLEKAKESIFSGKAAKKLESFISYFSR
jgi:anthranilate phosphoribosyltransferase